MGRDVRREGRSSASMESQYSKSAATFAAVETDDEVECVLLFFFSFFFFCSFVSQLIRIFYWLWNSQIWFSLRVYLYCSAIRLSMQNDLHLRVVPGVSRIATVQNIIYLSER